LKILIHILFLHHRSGATAGVTGSGTFVGGQASTSSGGTGLGVVSVDGTKESEMKPQTMPIPVAPEAMPMETTPEVMPMATAEMEMEKKEPTVVSAMEAKAE